MNTVSISISDILGAVLVVLKILGKISFSWWWVLAPFYVPLVLALVGFGAIIVAAAMLPEAKVNIKVKNASQ